MSNNRDSFYNGQSLQAPAIVNWTPTNRSSFYNGPFRRNSASCKPIHFEPPREQPQKGEIKVWYPTFGSLSTKCYQQTADMVDAQPPKPLPVYKKINLKLNKN
jgi:hypothetical protein